MKHFRFSLSILLTIFSLNGFSQTDFRPGYYISLNNDTIEGLIDYRGDTRNAKFCFYKKDENSKPVKFKPNDIKAYRYIDSKFYISRLIKTENEKKRIFVEYLVNGIADLFYYRDLQGDHYFIETEEGKLLELTNEEKTVYIEGMEVGNRKTNRHIGLLKATFADCMEIQSQVNKVELTHESLINITKNYHDYVCDGEKCIIYEKKLPIIKISFAPTIGLGISNLNFNNNHSYSDQNFDNNIYPSIGILINTTLPRLNEKLSFQIVVELNKNYFYSFYEESSNFSDNYYADIHIHTTSLQTSLGLNYAYPKGKIRPTIALGGVFNYFIKQDSKLLIEIVNNSIVNSYESYDLVLAPYLWGGYAQLGCDFQLTKKRIMFSNLRYRYSIGNYQNTETIIQSLNITVGLYL